MQFQTLNIKLAGKTPQVCDRKMIYLHICKPMGGIPFKKCKNIKFTIEKKGKFDIKKWEIF